MRPHVLGIDDAPFHKDQSQDVPIVGVMMEGATLVELGLSLTTIRSPSIFISQGFINSRRIYANVY